MALKHIDQDTLYPGGKRGLPGRPTIAIVNENTLETELRLQTLEGGTGGVSAALDALEQGQGALQSGLDAEELARTGADGELHARITAEQAARQAADNAEQEARQAADNALAARVDRIPGKNRFINGALGIWQRRFGGRVGVGAGSLGAEAYFADRFSHSALGCTHDVQRVDITGNTPIAYSARYAMVVTVSGATATSGAWMGQRIEGVRSLTGPATISFKGNGGTAGVKIGVRVIQQFGTGGSPAATVTTEAGVITLTAAAAQHSISLVIPSVINKTLGTNGNDNIYVVFDLCGTGYGGALVGQNAQFGLSEFYIEPGNTATTAVWRPEAYELALCQRFCEPLELVNILGITFTTNGDTRCSRPFKVRKRANPSLTYSGTLNVIGVGAGGHVLNIALGALSLGADTDVLSISGVSNIGGLSPAGAVVTWGDNGVGRCIAIADAEF